MSFQIDEFAGKPEAVLYYLDNFNEHPSATFMVEPIRKTIHALLDKLIKAKIAPTVLFKARGFVTSDGHVELEISLRTVRRQP